MDALTGKSAKRTSTASKKKAAGSDFSSTRGSEERHSSVQAQSAPRGQKRARDYDIEKVSQNSSSEQSSAESTSNPTRTEKGRVPRTAQSAGRSSTGSGSGKRSSRNKRSVPSGQKTRKGTPSPHLSTIEEEELSPPGKKPRLATTAPPRASKKRARGGAEEEEAPAPPAKRVRIILNVGPRSDSGSKGGESPPFELQSDAPPVAAAPPPPTATATGGRGRGRGGSTRGGSTRGGSTRGGGKGKAKPGSSAAPIAPAKMTTTATGGSATTTSGLGSHRGQSNGSYGTRNAARRASRERTPAPPPKPRAKKRGKKEEVPEDRLITAGYSEESVHPMHRPDDEAEYDQIVDFSQEEAFYHRPSVRLTVPDSLKGLIVDDWENVTKNLQLVPLPSRHPVNVILQDYFNDESTRRRRGTPEFGLLEEMIQGLRDYFERALGKILLYRFEREQYSELRQLWISNTDGTVKGAADVYGAEHLARLLGMC